jgi:nicotinate-nucleotide pyrophosphorylase
VDLNIITIILRNTDRIPIFSQLFTILPRIGLFDAFLIKENHIASCNNSITEAVKSAREVAPNKMVEVEVENFEQLEEAIAAGANVRLMRELAWSF